MQNEIDNEIEKLRERKMELSSKLNLIKDSQEKEKIRLQIGNLQNQIDMLSKFKKKSQ